MATGGLRTAFGLFSSDDMPAAFAPRSADPGKVYDDEVDPAWTDDSTAPKGDPQDDS